MVGKVIKINSSDGVFVQIDKNSQICDLYQYNRTLPKEERIGARIRGKVFDEFKGQPLYTAWNNLIETVKSLEL